MQSESKGVQLKNAGNEAFKEKDYSKAIDLYSQAIREDATQSIYFSNRAKAYKLLKKNEEAYQDALSAIELDDKNIKAHLISGQLLCERGKSEKDNKKIELAITRLIKARTLCAGQKKQDFEKELTTYIFKARKLLWMKEHEEGDKKNHELITTLQKLVTEDSILTAEQKLITTKQVDKYVKAQVKQMEIPDFMKCSLSKQLMLDPYTNESGNSYEKQVLYDYTNTNGAKDPVTNQKINIDHIYPNVNLRQATDDYIQKNPWAFQFIQGEKYQDIEF